MNNETLRKWWQDGLDMSATHLLVLFDIQLFTHIQAYAYPKESVISRITEYAQSPRYLIIDIFSYAEEFEAQLLEKRRENYS